MMICVCPGWGVESAAVEVVCRPGIESERDVINLLKKNKIISKTTEEGNEDTL